MTEFELFNYLHSEIKEKKEIEIGIEKDGFKAGSKFDWKILETFWSSHKLNFDQLIDMHHTELTRQKLKDQIFTKK